MECLIEIARDYSILHDSSLKDCMRVKLKDEVWTK